MRAVYEILSRRLVYSGQCHSQSRRQDKVPLSVTDNANLCHDLDLIIGEVMPRLSTHSQQSILKASCVSSCKQLFRIRGTSIPTKSLRQRQAEVEQPIVTPDRSMTASFCSNFRGIQRRHSFCLL
jgi:hypothetical protein